MKVCWSFFIVVALVSNLGCGLDADTNKSNSIICKPYFHFDEVHHYFIEINEDSLLALQEKTEKSRKDEKLLELLFEFTPETMSDSGSLQDFQSLGFTRRNVPANNFNQLGKIFCERNDRQKLTMSCIAVFRDILVFRKDNRIKGVAKVCFECGQSVVLGTDGSRPHFGQPGDYENLFSILDR